jgi:hypothetical protein
VFNFAGILRLSPHGPCPFPAWPRKIQGRKIRKAGYCFRNGIVMKLRLTKQVTIDEPHAGGDIIGGGA